MLLTHLTRFFLTPDEPEFFENYLSSKFNFVLFSLFNDLKIHLKIKVLTALQTEIVFWFHGYQKKRFKGDHDICINAKKLLITLKGRHQFTYFNVIKYFRFILMDSTVVELSSSSIKILVKELKLQSKKKCTSLFISFYCTLNVEIFA